MTKTNTRSRFVSILLCLVMVVGLFPTMAFAADGSGTASDPYIVTTFEELKAALEKDTVGLGMQYIKVPGGTNIDTVLRPETYSTAIAVARQKTLIVDGSVTVTGSATSQVLDSLFAINGNDTCLNIKGNGTLTFSANGNNGSNAVVRVDNNATLNVSGGVTLSGKFNTTVYGMAVYNYSGTVNIDNATLTGETGGVSYGAAIFATGGTTSIKNATLKSSVYPGASIVKKDSGTIFIGKDASLTIENSTVYTTNGVTDGHSIYLKANNTKHISDYLGTNQKIYKLLDDTPLSADVSSLTDSVNITDNISKEIDTVSLTIKSLNERKTLSDLECGYDPSSKMTLTDFAVCKGLNNTTDEIEDKNTAYDPNQGYMVMYLFTANEGFSFLPDVTNNVSVTSGDFWMADTLGGTNKLRVFVNIPASTIDNASLTIKPRDERKTLLDLKCGYDPSGRMTLTDFVVCKGLNNTTDEIEDKNTAYDPNQGYMVMYLFTSKEGFSFASNIYEKVEVTGGDFWMADTLGGTNKLRVFVNFPKDPTTGPNYVTEAAVQVAAPVAGEKPKGTVDIPVLGDNKDKVKKATMWWSGMLSGKTAFVAGQEYTAIVELAPKEGVTFADNMKLKVNGKVADLLSKDPTDGSVQFKVKFTAVDYVTEAAVQVAAVAGEKPSFDGITVTSSNADKIKRALVLWRTSTPFVAGQEYTTTVYLEPKEGVTFADDMKLNVNGKVVDLLAKDPTDGSVQFRVKITATGSTHTHSYGTDWKYDDTNHWHECECGDKADIAAHSASEWIVDTAATETAEGAKHKECTVCKKVLETATIPALRDYAVTVTGGKASVAAGTPITRAMEGVEVTVTAQAPAGKHFVKWVVKAGGVTLANETSATTTFIMPANDVTIEAEFAENPVEAYTLTVIKGTASVAAGTPITDKIEQNTVVTVTADAPETGKVFDKWVVLEGNVTLTDATSATTTFTMPASAVKIEATYKDAPPSHTHSYGTDWKYDDNNHWHECACGDKADIAAHSASEWIVDTAATETADGAKHKECTVCKKVLETAPIPATGSTHTHSYGTDWKYDDTNHWHECACGDKADTAAHSFQWVIDKAATKEATGSRHEECTVCGAKRSENTVIDKLPDGGNTGNTGSGDNNTDKPGKDDSTKSPQTGDSSNLIGWLAALFVSGGVLTLLGMNSKKRKESEAE